MLKLLPLFLCLIAGLAQAHIKPAEGSKLNHLIAGFVAGEQPGISRYRLQVAEGHYTDEKEFARHIIIDKQVATNRTIAELPRFGASYTWRYTYLSSNGKVKSQTRLFHFATDTCDAVDTSRSRLKVISNSLGNSELMVTTDFRTVIYNLEGKPLWFLPRIAKFGERIQPVRDFKPTPYGTFTCLYGFNAIEVDYEGNLIWEAPNDGKVNGDTSEYYHHEMTRLSNGNYMVCGDEIWWAKPDSILYGSKDMPKDIELQARKGRNYRRYVFGTLIEYDSKGNIVWQWKSKEHFPRNEQVPVAIKPNYSGFIHLNSFFFNEKDSVIYMSFRDINRIVKIKYPTSEWLNSYGDKYGNDSLEPQCDLFCGQHCVRKAADGKLYLFDNHPIKGANKLLSYISIYTEPLKDDKQANLTPVWTFPCDIDTNAAGGTSTGGGVYMLPNETLLCTMGSAGRVFVVDRNKQVLWNAVSQQRAGGDKIWRNTAEYRVYPIVNKTDLERFIFH